jgi:iron complex outermembrane receptor protein
VATPVLAQGPAVVTPAALDVPAGPLKATIAQVEAHFGASITVAAAEWGDRRVGAVQRATSARDALDQALRGHGLALVTMADGLLVTTPAEAAVLNETVEVRATAPARQSRTGVFASAPLVDTPMSLNVVGREVIESQRADTSAEVLKNDPAVVVEFPGSAYGYYDSFNLRGFDANNWYSYRLDGLAFANQGETAIEDKEQIEILKGPAALQFGFAPPGGIVNYARKRPPAASLRSAVMDVTSNGVVTGQVDVGGRALGGRLGWRAVGLAERWDSFYAFAAGDRQLGAVTADVRLGDRALVRLAADTHHRDTTVTFGVPIGTGGRIFDDLPVDTNLSGPDSFYRTRSGSIQGDAEVRLSASALLRTTTSFNAFSRDNLDLGPSYSTADDGTYEAFQYLSLDERRPALNHQTHVEWRTRTGAIQHTVAAGGAWRRIDAWWSDGVFAPLGTASVTSPQYFEAQTMEQGPSLLRFRTQDAGVFVTDRLQFGERWSALAGLRFGRIETREYDDVGGVVGRYDGEAWIPSGALMYQATRAVNVYVLASGGLESGGTAPRGTVNEFAQLAPRRSRQVEAGAKYEDARGRFGVDLALFDVRRDLELVNAANLYVQDGLQHHRGVEAVVRGRPTTRLLLQGGVMLLDATQERTSDAETEGRRPRAAARVRGSVYAELDIPSVAGLGVTSGLYWSGDRFADATEAVRLPGYARVDLGARYRFDVGGRSQTVRLAVENVGDVRYLVGGYAWAGSGGNAFFGMPRTVRLSFQTGF